MWKDRIEDRWGDRKWPTCIWKDIGGDKWEDRWRRQVRGQNVGQVRRQKGRQLMRQKQGEKWADVIAMTVTSSGHYFKPPPRASPIGRRRHCTGELLDRPLIWGTFICGLFITHLHYTYDHKPPRWSGRGIEGSGVGLIYFLHPSHTTRFVHRLR